MSAARSTPSAAARVAWQIVAFQVAGVPAPQGSKVRTRWGMREDNPHTAPWRNAVAAAAAEAMGGAAPLAGSVRLEADFYFPRPKSHYRTGKHAGSLRAGAPRLHSGRPDLDKLLRALGDALTGVVLIDDAQVAIVGGRKLYGTPGAHISVQVEP